MHLQKLIKKGVFIIVLVFASVIFSACDQSTIFHNSEVMENSKWEQTDTLFAKVDITDTTHYHNIFVTARLSALYPYSNIYFKVLVIGPSGQRFTDITSFEVTDKTGKWLGKGFGDLHSYEFPLYQDLALKEEGAYKIKVIPYMRNEILLGVHDRGLKINLGKEIF